MIDIDIKLSKLKKCKFNQLQLLLKALQSFKNIMIYMYMNLFIYFLYFELSFI